MLILILPFLNTTKANITLQALPTDPRYSACFAVSSSYSHMRNAKPLEERLQASYGGNNFFLEISRALFYL